MIQRWKEKAVKLFDNDWSVMFSHNSEGDWIKHADHLREVERLRGLLRDWSKLKMTPAYYDDLVRRTDAELGEK